MENMHEYYEALIYSDSRSRLPKETTNDLLMSINRVGVADKIYPVASTVYINTLDFPVTVIEPSGKRFRVSPKKHDVYRDSFVIRQTISMDYSEHSEMVNWMTYEASVVDNKYSQLLADKGKGSSVGFNPSKAFGHYALAKEIGTMQAPKTQYAGTVNIWSAFFEDYVVCTSKDFQSRESNGKIVHSNEIYHTPTCVTVSVKSLQSALPNPNEFRYSGAERIDLLEKQSRISGEDVTERFEFICKSGSHHPRYIKIGNRVCTIYPKKRSIDPRPDGIYHTYQIRNPASIQDFDLKTDYYPIDMSSDVCGIYYTYEEASYHGFADRKAIETIRKKEEEISDLKRDVDLFKAKVETDKLVHKAREVSVEEKIKEQASKIEDYQKQIRNLESDKNHLREREILLEERIDQDRRRDQENDKAQREAEKAKYERSSLDRKDHTDYVKFLQGAVIAIGAFFTFFKKTRN